MPWLKLKFSSIENSGLGVFSSWNFKKNEFITYYLGEVNQNPSDDEYTFMKINGKPLNSLSGLLEDYWFGHWIQHGRGNQVNVTITSGYVIKAKKTLKLVKNFSWITIDLYFAENVKLKLIFMINVSRSLRSAIFVEMWAWMLKSATGVKLFWFAFSVMTNHRSQFNKIHLIIFNVINKK
jgi:hypothetical protein